MLGVMSGRQLLTGGRLVVSTGDEFPPEAWTTRCSPAGTSGRSCHSPYNADIALGRIGKCSLGWQDSFTVEHTALRPSLLLWAPVSMASICSGCSGSLSIVNGLFSGRLGLFASERPFSQKGQRKHQSFSSMSVNFDLALPSQTPSATGAGYLSCSQSHTQRCRALTDHFDGRDLRVGFRSVKQKYSLQRLNRTPSSRDSGQVGGRGSGWWPCFGLPLAYNIQSMTSARPRSAAEQDVKQRNVHRNCVPSFRDTPPKRDTGIASEKDWNINLKNQPINESGLNEDGSTWFRESGEDLGENGFRSRWTVMGGRSGDGTVEWKETWWEKSDWTGYKELGAEKSGRNTLGDSWWETWQEVYRQDEWSGLARIEKSAHKQAKSRNGGVWNEKWWEKYNAKGWAEKGAHKYGKLNDQGWWEKWGEQYDGQGAVIKWTDKWAESDSGTKWGDKWDERFNNGIGMRQGETWHVAASGNRWSRTWGEEHFGTGEVHKYGKSTSGELWDIKVKEPTYYEAEPHYGWADAVVNSLQLLSIEIREKPQDILPYSDLDTLS